MPEHTPHQPTAEQAPPADTGESWQELLIDEVVEHRQRLHALEAQSSVPQSVPKLAFLAAGFLLALILGLLHQPHRRFTVDNALVHKRGQ